MVHMTAERAAERTHSPTRLIPLENGTEFAGIKIGFGLDPGLLRTDQQDNVGVFAVERLGKPPQLLAILADGMGGHAGGEEASKIAVKTISSHYASYLQDGVDDAHALAWAILDADTEIQQLPFAQEDGEPGTTLDLVLLDTATGHGRHIRIGDSRAYVLTHGANAPQPLAIDQSEAALKVLAGQLTYDQIYEYDRRNMITRFLGNREPSRRLLEKDLVSATNDLTYPNFFAREFALDRRQRLLMCSDGLWEMVKDTQIQTIIDSSRLPQDAVRALLHAANVNGGEDNISAIVLEAPSAIPQPIEKPRPVFQLTEVTSGETIGDFSVGFGADIGKVKPSQQDNVRVFHVEKPGETSQILAVLADGMGGHANGALASTIAVTYIPERYLFHLNNHVDSDTALALAIMDAHEKIKNVCSSPGKKPGGTTLSLALVEKSPKDGSKKIIQYRIGDSRGYLFSPENKTLESVANDQSGVARALEYIERFNLQSYQGELSKGVSSKEDLYTHPQRHLLSTYLGDPTVNLTLEQLLARKTTTVQTDELAGREIVVDEVLRKRILLCSDGLWEMVRDDEITRIFTQNLTPQKTANLLIETANYNGGEDNISVIVLDVLPVKIDPLEQTILGFPAERYEEILTRLYGFSAARYKHNKNNVTKQLYERELLPNSMIVVEPHSVEDLWKIKGNRAMLFTVDNPQAGLTRTYTLEPEDLFIRGLGARMMGGTVMLPLAQDGFSLGTNNILCLEMSKDEYVQRMSQLALDLDKLQGKERRIFGYQKTLSAFLLKHFEFF